MEGNEILDDEPESPTKWRSLHEESAGEGEDKDREESPTRWRSLEEEEGEERELAGAAGVGLLLDARKAQARSAMTKTGVFACVFLAMVCVCACVCACV